MQNKPQRPQTYSQLTVVYFTLSHFHMKMFLKLLLLLAFLSRIQHVICSELTFARRAFLRKAVCDRVEEICPRSPTKKQMDSLRYGLKNSLNQAHKDMHNKRINVDNVMPNSETVQLYSEYICSTHKNFGEGSLPKLPLDFHTVCHFLSTVLNLITFAGAQ